jgi:hypothetical protein
VERKNSGCMLIPHRAVAATTCSLLDQVQNTMFPALNGCALLGYLPPPSGSKSWLGLLCLG